MFCSLCTQPCISFALCAAQMHSRFFRSLLRYPGHPYRSDVMVAKPPASALPRIGGATQPRASLPRLSPHSPQRQPISLLSRHSPQPPQPRAPLRGQPWKPGSTISPAERQRLMETQPSSASASTSQQPPQEPAESAGQAQSVPAEPSVASPKASRKQPPYKLDGSMVSPRTLKVHFDEHGSLPDNITDLNGEPLAMNAAVSLALTIAAMGPATPKPKTSGNLASPEPQPPPAKAPSKPGSWANLTEEEQQERDRAFEREHREDGHKISAHFATKKASQPQEASPAKTQPSSNTAARHASHEDTHTAQPDNQPSDAASDVSDMRAEMAAMQASLQQQLQKQMAAMMALLQQQQQQPSAAEQTAPKAKPLSKAPELTPAEPLVLFLEPYRRAP